GTFGAMYLLGYSIDNLSLMALTVATGFVVDDAIVVIENITRHLEKGLSPLEAALRGAKEIGFTVMSISISLIAGFIPILLMGGIVGRLFREFAVTLSVSILISLVISLTATPMMCARLLKPHRAVEARGRFFRRSERAFTSVIDRYRRSLGWLLRRQPLTLAVTLATMAATIFLYVKVPKGFFPQQDSGRLTGSIQGDQQTSFQAMQRKLSEFMAIVMEDPDIESANGFLGGTANSGRMFVSLKPKGQRKASADQIIGRLRRAPAPRAGRKRLSQPGD